MQEEDFAFMLQTSVFPAASDLDLNNGMRNLCGRGGGVVLTSLFHLTHARLGYSVPPLTHLCCSILFVSFTHHLFQAIIYTLSLGYLILYTSNLS